MKKNLCRWRKKGDPIYSCGTEAWGLHSLDWNRNLTGNGRRGDEGPRLGKATRQAGLSPKRKDKVYQGASSDPLKGEN